MSASRRFWRLLSLSTCLVFLFAACGDDNDPSEEGTDPGSDNNYFINNDAPQPDNDADDDTDDVDANDGNNNSENNAGPDMDEPDQPDVEDPDPIDPTCDKDNDGVESIECGGADCDDNDPLRNTLRTERCDQIDNNCDGNVNEGLDCTFYAHSGEMLYRVEPFQKLAIPVAEVPGLHDIDTHPNGTLFGITREQLYRFDDTRQIWILLGGFTEQGGDFTEIEDANGLAIDSEGNAFITAANALWSVDLVSARVTRVGNMGGDYYSSGDCVVNKYDTLFMTSKDFDQNDELVMIDRSTGRATPVGLSYHRKIFGLTAGWEGMYGLTGEGDLLLINTNTGESTLIHTFQDIRWFGAASTPGR